MSLKFPVLILNALVRLGTVVIISSYSVANRPSQWVTPSTQAELKSHVSFVCLHSPRQCIKQWLWLSHSQVKCVVPSLKDDVDLAFIRQSHIVLVPQTDRDRGGFLCTGNIMWTIRRNTWCILITWLSICSITFLNPRFGRPTTDVTLSSVINSL